LEKAKKIDPKHLSKGGGKKDQGKGIEGYNQQK